MIKLYSFGDDVREVERLLVEQGYSLIEDAYFDENTENAVKKFQRNMGLVVDGIVGPKTMKSLKQRFRDPKLLTHQNIQQASVTLKVSPAAILALNEIESAGAGFLDDGRVKILYERHIMYKRLMAAGYDADALSIKTPKIVNPRRGGYRGGWAEYSRLKSAQAIDHDIALESCSWGQYQIMGFHWQALGFENVRHFVRSMEKSEAEQLNAFVKFILLDEKLHKALKEKKWETFARIYNGAAYKSNLYDVKLSRAYARHSANNEKIAA